MRVLTLAATVVVLGATPAVAPPPWGADGHEMAARAAVEALPSELPAFFRLAGEQLVYLNPEPDRWKDRDVVEMDQAWTYDHYVDLEHLPDGALDAPDRFVFLQRLYEDGRLEKPERDAGFLPFRIVELYQRLVTEWRLWHGETDPSRRSWIEDRIVNDAGLLGHYVTDGSQPHHTTIHFNGWSDDAPNPGGYTRDRSFHARFETDFVRRHVSQADVSRRVDGPVTPVDGPVREAVTAYLAATHGYVEELYRLDRDVGFDPDAAASPAARDFAAERLAAGARMLATLWLSAWEQGRG